jgi:hypothetical protein
LQTVPTVAPTQTVSLQLPHVLKPAFSEGAGANEGSLACASGATGAEKIAARFALAGSAGVAAVSAALAREPTSSSAANARKVSLSFMRASFEKRFTDEPRDSRQPLIKKVPLLSSGEPR